MATSSSLKGAIIPLTRTLAQELGPLGITVNTIAPGSIGGTIMYEANKDRALMAEETLIQGLPVRRLGAGDDIAHACAFLCAEEAG